MKERIVINQDWLVKDMKAGVPELDKLFICQKVEEVPESIEDVKNLLDKLKIDYESVYVNDKDFRWTTKDKVKVLRAINIEFKTKFDDSFTQNNITISNYNDITVRKYKYKGQEFITMQLSTMEQVWNIFVNLYKDVAKEK